MLWEDGLLDGLEPAVCAGLHWLERKVGGLSVTDLATVPMGLVSPRDKFLVAIRQWGTTKTRELLYEFINKKMYIWESSYGSPADLMGAVVSLGGLKTRRPRHAEERVEGLEGLIEEFEGMLCTIANDGNRAALWWGRALLVLARSVLALHQDQGQDNPSLIEGFVALAKASAELVVYHLRLEVRARAKATRLASRHLARCAPNPDERSRVWMQDRADKALAETQKRRKELKVLFAKAAAEELERLFQEAFT